jgi:hypothetical protein
MTKYCPEPIERLEEILSHPADRTFESLRSAALHTKNQLKKTREELLHTENEEERAALMAKIVENHNELMEILKYEESTLFKRL